MVNESYQLGSLLCESREHYLRALCESFLYGDGLNSKDEVKQFFVIFTNEQLTRQIMDEWIEQDGTVSDIEYDEVMAAMQAVKDSIGDTK